MRQQWIDVLKGWGIAFIVLGHIIGAGCHLSTGSTQTFCDLGYKYFYAFHVPLFFFVSGVTFKRREWGAFFKGKFFRFLVPYFGFGICSILVYNICDQVAISILQSNETTTYYHAKAQVVPCFEQLLGLFLGGFGNRCFIANAVLWFVPVLFTLEIVMQGVIRLSTSARFLVSVGVGMFLLVALFGTWIPKIPWGGDLVPKYIPFFVLGMIWRHKQIPIRWWSIALAVLCVIGSGVIAVMNPYQYFPKTVCQYGINFVIACINILSWTLISSIWSWQGLAFLGQISLVVMFCHKFPLLLMQNFLSPVRKLFTTTIPSVLFATSLVFVFSILCCISVYFVSLRWCPWMIGQKRKNRQEDK